jgi:hypothetical protein
MATVVGNNCTSLSLLTHLEGAYQNVRRGVVNLLTGSQVLLIANQADVLNP